MIITFPEYVLNKDIDNVYHNPDSIEAKLYSDSEKFIAYITQNISENISNNFIYKIGKLINSLSDKFDLFSIMDKKSKINELIQEWYGQEITKSEIQQSNNYTENQKIDIIRIIDKSQLKVIKLIKNIDKNFDIALLEKYKEFNKEIKKIYHQVFWDILVTELTNNKYDMFMSLLIEIRNNLDIISPKMKKEYDEYIDIDFIQQKIKYNVMDTDDFISLFTYIVDKIILLQAPIKNKITLERWNIILDKSKSDDFVLFLANGIKFIIENIKDIEEDIMNYIMMLEINK
jgi:hypothetical protein